jgi:hypothetical protein
MPEFWRVQRPRFTKQKPSKNQAKTKQKPSKNQAKTKQKPSKNVEIGEIQFDHRGIPSKDGVFISNPR